MSKDEFVGLHGEEAWDILVKWRQEFYGAAARRGCESCGSARANMNAIVDADMIQPVLQLLELKSWTILEARKEIETTKGEPHGRTDR